MKTAEVLKNETVYLGQETIDGVQCDIGYIKKFKWSWVATQLNTFVIIGSINSVVDKNAIESFSGSCFKYALKNNRGWPRGLQSGVASIAILPGKTFENDAISFCERLTKKHWSAVEIPVLYNIDQKKCIRFKKNPLWGAIYFPFFAKTIDAITSKLD